jgi:flagellar protein FliS
MYTNTNTGKAASAMNPYLLNNIMDATPAQLLLKVYDFAVVHCKKQDLSKTNAAIQTLIDALRFDGGEEVKEVSIGLLRLYQYCQEQTRRGNFESVQMVLTELRESWSVILK